MKTHAALPFSLHVKEGAQYHEPFAHHDGVTLAGIINDAAGSLFFGIAAGPDGWEWPLTLVPINAEDLIKLEAGDQWHAELWHELLSRANGYYVWDLMPHAGHDKTEFFEGPVPDDYKPRL